MQAPNGSEALSSDEERVLGFLRAQWDEPLRITSVQQAMDALGMPRSVQMRLRIGAYLADHLSLSARLARFGTQTFVLTEDEKLLARYISSGVRRSGVLPPAVELGRACSLPPDLVDSGLQVLADLGFLRRSGERYRVARGAGESAGDLAFTFHTVTLESGERFNVP